MFRVDFGPDSLPHEAGRRVVDEAVSFSAGCYRGQEIVARMESRKKQAKVLVCWKMVGGEMKAMGDEAAPLVVAGSPLYESAGADSDTVGAVTSSVHAPLRSQCPVGLAMVKWGFHEPGTKLIAPAEGRNVEVEVLAGPVVGGG